MLDPDREAGFRRVICGLGMDYLRPVICKLNRLFKADFRQRGCIRTNARISGEYTINIGPYPDFIGACSCANDGGGVIGPSAAQRGGLALRVRTAISSDDRHNAALDQRKQRLLALSARGFNIRLSVAKITVRYDHLFRADKRSVRSQLLKTTGQRPR